MDDLVDVMIDKETPAADITDKIKDLLFAKTAGKVDTLKPEVAASMFGEPESPEATSEVEPQEEEPRNED
tara:strand:- start:705 stop:914 length:210 start_codon:yes stop_codon:yes gene_type:complete